VADTSNRQALEQALLTDPFNAELRRRYATALLDSGEPQAALDQAELLRKQSGNDGAASVLAARALLALDRREDALQRYAQARALPGFEPHDGLEALQQHTVRAGGPALQLVGGSTTPVVRAIQQVSEEKVRFSSIAGMEDLKKTIRLKIIEPFVNPGLFARFRAKAGGGILLYGPPGCGKTMIARAVANECRASFISVGISDILNMWLGESERNLAAMFAKARADAPCVLFFDELDALAYSRSKATSNTTRTVVNEFLNQLDGMGNDNRNVLVLAATNMPWDVDSAMKRPGRFARQIFVPPPDAAARRAMLETKLTGIPQQGLDFDALAAATEHYSGADIDGLIELAKESALADNLASGGERPLQPADFEYALRQSQPSTLDWLRSVRNVVKYAGDDGSYAEVERHLRQVKLL
jgi:SpoVK/Ycf46/Vps4 family AAA+-type ATPase